MQTHTSVMAATVVGMAVVVVAAAAMAVVAMVAAAVATVAADVSGVRKNVALGCYPDHAMHLGELSHAPVVTCFVSMARSAGTASGFD